MTNLGWKEWVDKTISVQVGCENNCSYCWAMFLGLQRKYVEKKEDWKTPRPKKQRDCLKKNYGVVGYPGTHDIHESNLKKSIGTIRTLLRYGNDVIIVTWDGYEPNLHAGSEHREGIDYGRCNP